ncbi:MAG: NAD(P)-dependent oxidoreductase [Bacteroidales bacterium]
MMVRSHIQAWRQNFFDRVRRGTSIINTSRGGVIDESMLTSRIKSGQISGTVIDVWENEPEILMMLLQLADSATILRFSPLSQDK